MNSRKYFLVIFIISICTICYTLFAEYYQHYIPCPLCLLQRWVLYGITFLSLIFAIHKTPTIITKIYNIIIIALSIFGITVAYKHLWIISLPIEQRPQSCGMPLKLLFNKLPIKNFVEYILQGSAECGNIDWKIFGMIAPLAFCILCIVFIAIMLLALFRNYKDL
jgi:disulfide bond formation protein DsbB